MVVRSEAGDRPFGHPRGPRHFPPSVFGYRSPSGEYGMPAPGRAFGCVGDRPPCPCRNACGRGPYDPVGEGRWPSFVSAALSPFCFGSWEHEPKTRRCRNRSRFRRRWHRSRNRRKTMPEESERRGLVCSGPGLGSVFPVSGCGGRIVYSGGVKSGKKIAQGVEK